MKYFAWCIVMVGLGGCLSDSENSQSAATDAEVQEKGRTRPVGTPSGEELVEYAKSLYGVPYKYGSTDPQEGFDCSGFIHHVYTHFAIEVPRSSIDFTDVGTPVEVQEAAPGDLVLFTGTNPENRVVGHIGIVVNNGNEGLEFIHSTSGKQYSVTITPLAGYYETRFVKVIRVM